MKLLLTILTAITLTIGLTAKPEKGGKGDNSGRPSREEMIKKFDSGQVVDFVGIRWRNE